ncbi:MAG TPA: hypothetical protein VLL54_21445 [Pyrinomonadaceae bacterium]|nr:hypothetical protein [Pyrinomonadaceae bacterium]
MFHSLTALYEVNVGDAVVQKLFVNELFTTDGGSNWIDVSDGPNSFMGDFWGGYGAAKNSFSSAGTLGAHRTKTSSDGAARKPLI